jgi:diketogulonate reductase-like aldo/keto reductase
VIVIPRSTEKQRIQEDFNVFNFNLTAEEISSIESLNVNLRYNTEDSAKNHRFYPFRIPY